jgi:hypothetical protein
MYRKPIFGSPWGGWNDSAPSISLPASSFKQIINWLINKGAIFPLPTLTTQPDPLSELLGGRTFRDGLGNLHTVVIKRSAPGYYDPATFPVYNFVVNADGSGGLSPQSNNPFAIEVMNNTLYFANGAPPLSYVDGDNNFYTAGDTPGTCFYLGKLASHLLQVCTVEPTATLATQTFPNRVRYSASGNGNEWDNTVDFTAGVIDIPDVEDILTGWATLTNVGFAFRQNGITSFTPTGVGGSPFFVENFSIGPAGVGCFYAYTLAVYGYLCVFAAENDIYLFTSSAPQAIGGPAKKSIIRELGEASSFTTSSIIGSIEGIGDFLSYWLFIPQSNDSFTSTWVYHFDSQTWVNFILPYGAARFLANLVTH